jgi:hypothetical protein
MQHIANVPPVDFTPTGRALLYIPEQPSEHPGNVVPAGACPIFRDCAENEPGHYDHFNYEHKVTGDDGSTILDIGMTALSDGGGPVVSIRNEDLTSAAAVHAKTAELRRLLDQVDAMAVRVFRDHKARG